MKPEPLPLKECIAKTLDSLRSPEAERNMAMLAAEDADVMYGPAAGNPDKPLETPLAFLLAYGMNPEDPDDRDEYPELSENHSAAQNVAGILRQSLCWGEFVGGVIVNYWRWSTDDQREIRNSLIYALAEACRLGGFDH